MSQVKKVSHSEHQTTMSYDDIKSSLESIKNNINDQSVGQFSLEEINNINDLFINTHQKLHNSLTQDAVSTLVDNYNFNIVVQEKSFEEIMTFILELAQGNYANRIEINENNQIIDSLSMAANLLAEELQWKSDKINENNLKLVEKSHFISNITEAVSDIIYIASIEDSSIKFINKSIKAFLGHEELSELGSKIHDIISITHPDDQDKIKEDFENIRSLNAGEKIKTEFRIRKADDTWLWAYREIIPFKFLPNGQLYEVLGKLTDITEIKEKEQSFRETAERLKALNETSTDAIIITDKNERILSWSKGAASLFGHSESEALGQGIGMILSQKYSDIQTSTFNPVSNNESFSKISSKRELEAMNKNGDTFPIELNLSTWGIENNKHLGAIIRDISKRKAHEKFLIDSNSEKEVLLKEVHHRVKNNLQIVNSMLDIQIRKSNDKKVKQALNNSRGRIKSISLIHEQLYQYEHLSKIEFGRYVRSLAEGIDMSFRDHEKKVQLCFELETMEIDINSAIPLGLICNELIINSYKHSDKVSETLTISVHLNYQDDKKVLTISDNGIGLPPDFEDKQKLSLGYKIINSLIYQLKGSMDFVPSKKGTTVKIQF